MTAWQPVRITWTQPVAQGRECAGVPSHPGQPGGKREWHHAHRCRNTPTAAWCSCREPRLVEKMNVEAVSRGRSPDRNLRRIRGAVPGRRTAHRARRGGQRSDRTTFGSLTNSEHAGRYQHGKAALELDGCGIAKDRCDGPRREALQHGGAYVHSPDVAHPAAHQVLRVEARAGAELQHLGTRDVAKERANRSQLSPARPRPGKAYRSRPIVRCFCRRSICPPDRVRAQSHQLSCAARPWMRNSPRARNLCGVATIRCRDGFTLARHYTTRSPCGGKPASSAAGLRAGNARRRGAG